MTSVILTRRAMLSGGALLGMSALLAACGQQANNEVAATASAAPSETASVSAVAPESHSASAPRLLSAATRATQKRPMGNTARLISTVRHRMCRSLTHRRTAITRSLWRACVRRWMPGFCGVITVLKLVITRWLASSSRQISNVN